MLTPLVTVLYSISSMVRRAMSVRSALICWLARSWFTTTLFLMLRARLAYFSVFRVSMKSLSDGLTHAIITVRLERGKREIARKREREDVSMYTGLAGWCVCKVCNFFDNEMSN